MGQILEVSAPAAPYERHLDPQWVRLLGVLQMNVRYARCQGVELFTEDARRTLDSLSGYSVHNTGHNHPEIVEAIKAARRPAPGFRGFHGRASGHVRADRGLAPVP